MDNKLGLSKDKLYKAEREIVSLKMNSLDECFGLNQDIFNLNYLEKLHKFLFSDLYYDYQLEIRIKDESPNINFILESIKNICTNKPIQIEEILNLVHDIWYLQPFCDGNTRTMIAYLNILNCIYNLNLSIDLNEEIKSKPSTFKKERFVNQKQLTKHQ